MYQSLTKMRSILPTLQQKKKELCWAHSILDNLMSTFAVLHIFWNHTICIIFYMSFSFSLTMCAYATNVFMLLLLLFFFRFKFYGISSNTIRQVLFTCFECKQKLTGERIHREHNKNDNFLIFQNFAHIFKFVYIHNTNRIYTNFCK